MIETEVSTISRNQLARFYLRMPKNKQGAFKLAAVHHVTKPDRTEVKNEGDGNDISNQDGYF